ncbi:MAG: tetratricopeptide repeat protein [Deltaproteobacteria bacterium]|jgi:tetratricopeptide (TPR) repeat protein|nr:tetratricopeptide repeat protein [Deltaproteobacteria bacterium]
MADMVRKNTMMLAAAAAFCAGLFVGLLTATLTRPPEQAPRPAAAAPAEDAELARLERAVRAAPQDAAAWAALGNLYFDRHQPAEAVRAYESSLAIKPNDPDVLTDLGTMYRHLDEFDKALSLFRRASALDPQHHQSVFNQGVVLFFDLKQEAEALRIWDGLARARPDYIAPSGEKLADMVKKYARQSSGKP